MEVAGEVTRGFEPVRDAFAALFERGEETGAAFAAIAGGRAVANLWGGSVGRDSLVHVFSVTKPLAAACALWLVDRGRIALDARVADVWPEYAAGGKQDTTLRQMLRSEEHTSELQS